MKICGMGVIVGALGLAGLAAGVSFPQGLSAQIGEVPANYFAMTINRPLSTPWPSIPFGSLRLWDTKTQWVDISPVQGAYDWSTLDQIVERAQRQGIDLIYTIGGRTPRWASANPSGPPIWRPGQCGAPSNTEYWDEFVRAIVTRMAGKIKYWEIWNEPQDPQFYCGDIPTMVALAEHAYKIIKSIDPSLQVLTPSPTSMEGPQWMARYLTAGGGRYADIMAFHGYWDTNPESIVTLIAKYKKIFADTAQSSKPIWDTEGSWGPQKHLQNPDQQAAFTARSYLLQWSAGVDRFYWYSYDNLEDSDGGWGTLWDSTYGLRKAGIAYREVRKWMVGATMDTPCQQKYSLTRGFVWTCHFSRHPGYHALAIWQPVGSSLYPVPEQYKQYRTLDGEVVTISGKHVQIGNKPTLLETGSAF